MALLITMKYTNDKGSDLSGFATSPRSAKIMYSSLTDDVSDTFVQLRLNRTNFLSGEGLAQLDRSDLISRARRGDDAAWEMLVRDHQEAIFRLAYLLLGDAHEAEDIAQDVFVRAFRALDTLTRRGPCVPGCYG